MAKISLSKALDERPGWYRGDFHAHSNCSDGDYPVETVTRIAEAEGLDFYAITDHNNIEALASLEEGRKTLVIPGLEVSFRQGHFNVFGIQGWEDWMEGLIDQNSFELNAFHESKVINLLENIAADGLITSINHPLLFPWAWEIGAIDLRHVSCLEIWNDLYWPENQVANPQTVAMWTRWLNAGHRITGIGGSDFHYPPRPEQGLPGERLGLPATYVYAKELSIKGILEGLRKGRAYVTKGPKIGLQASVGGSTFEIGDDLGEQSDEICFSVTITNTVAKAIVRLIKSGQVIAKKELTSEFGNLEFYDQADPNSFVWYSIQIANQDSEVLTISNPIYAGPRCTPKLNLYADYK